MKRLLSGVAILALIAAASGARAAQGWYVAGGAGGHFLNDITTTSSNIFGDSLTTRSDFDAGFGGSGALGYAWDSHGNAGGGAIFRIEGEVLYRTSDLNDLAILAITQTFLGPIITVGTLDGTGDVSTLGLMVNGWYEFSTGMPWRPYIGGGAGMANISLNDVGFDFFGLDITLVDDDDWVFAYQFGAGLNYEITPQVVVGVEYRYFATADPTFTDVFGGEFDGNISSHNIGLIARFMF